MHHAEERHGTALGVFALIFLIALGLIVTLHAPARDQDQALHDAAAVSW